MSHSVRYLPVRYSSPEVALVHAANNVDLKSVRTKGRISTTKFKKNVAVRASYIDFKWSRYLGRWTEQINMFDY